MTLKILEREALIDAANRPNGWALFKAKTTAKLAERGWFEKAKHPYYGMQWRITEAGRLAIAESDAQWRKTLDEKCH